MFTLKTLKAQIEEGIGQIPRQHTPPELYDPIRYTLNLGGKRLRPALCLLACSLVGGDIKNALHPALGLEIFHNFTLLHDDIMDKASLRRGKKTVHLKWNPNVAILSGDTMMALSYEYIMKAPEQVRSEVFSIFNKTAIEVCEGQQYDMNFESKPDVALADYLEMIRLKTAVLLAGSLKIGAVIGGADQQVSEALYSFGEDIGIAFQLKDDLLDVYGDAEKFGKATGGDIKTNKKTFLYLTAFEQAKGEMLNNLHQLFSRGESDPDVKVKEVIKIYNSLSIREQTEEKINSFYSRALEALNTLNYNKATLSELKKFANQLKLRDY